MSAAVFLPRYRRERNRWVEVRSSGDAQRSGGAAADEQQTVSELPGFEETVMQAFRGIVENYCTPYVGVTAQELVTHCSGTMYAASFGGEREIVNSPYYVNEAYKVLARNCVRDGACFRYPCEGSDVGA